MLLIPCDMHLQMLQFFLTQIFQNSFYSSRMLLTQPLGVFHLSWMLTTKKGSSLTVVMFWHLQRNDGPPMTGSCGLSFGPFAMSVSTSWGTLFGSSRTISYYLVLGEWFWMAIQRVAEQGGLLRFNSMTGLLSTDMAINMPMQMPCLVNLTRRVGTFLVILRTSLSIYCPFQLRLRSPDHILLPYSLFLLIHVWWLNLQILLSLPCPVLHVWVWAVKI